MDQRSNQYSQFQDSSAGTPSFRSLQELYLNGGSGSKQLNDSSLDIKSMKLRQNDENAAFSLSDFPALATNGDALSVSNGLFSSSQVSHSPSPLGGLGGLGMLNLNSNQPYSFHARPQKQSNFVIQKEDFPALPQNSEDVSAGFSLDVASPSPRAQDPEDQFSLASFAAEFRSDFLSIGVKSRSLGLSMSSKSALSESFGSFCFDQGSHAKIRRGDPNFTIPESFIQSGEKAKNLQMQSGKGRIAHQQKQMKKHSLSTLIYTFYSFPGDLLQALAAQELTRRNWQFHLGSQEWFLQGGEAASELVGFTVTSQQFIVFNRKTWKKQLHPGRPNVGPNGELFMSPEQISSFVLQQSIS